MDLVEQIQNLKRNARAYQAKVLGADWGAHIEEVYYMKQYTVQESMVTVSDLQMIFIQEANDLTDAQPIIYISKSGSDKPDRLEIVEKSLQATWRQNFINLELLKSVLFSLYFGTAYVQVYFDPFANEGQGNIYARSRDPRTCYVDPNAQVWEDAYWVAVDDIVYIDEIRRRYPQFADKIQLKLAAKSSTSGGGEGENFGLTFPKGPMREMGPLDASRVKAQDGQVLVTTLWIKDSTREETPTEEQVKIPFLPKQGLRFKYPMGRQIVMSEGMILQDTQNPFRKFPIVPVYGLPPIMGILAPPPVRASERLQEVFSSLLNQALDNATRLNNGLVFFKESAGLDESSFDNSPGSVHVIPNNADPPTMIWPQPMPATSFQLLEMLLKLQHDWQGWSDSRQGKAGAGNISANLNESSIAQSQGLTSVRSKFLVQSIESIATVMIGLMIDFYLNDRYFTLMTPSGIDYIHWKPLSVIDDAGTIIKTKYDVQVDPGSVRPLAESALRSLVPMLRNMGMIDIENALKLLNIPNASEIYQKLMLEQELAAETKKKGKP